MTVVASAGYRGVTGGDYQRRYNFPWHLVPTETGLQPSLPFLHSSKAQQANNIHPCVRLFAAASIGAFGGRRLESITVNNPAFGHKIGWPHPGEWPFVCVLHQ